MLGKWYMPLRDETEPRLRLVLRRGTIHRYRRIVFSKWGPQIVKLVWGTIWYGEMSKRKCQTRDSVG
jgi:hypothetical protein